MCIGILPFETQICNSFINDKHDNFFLCKQGLAYGHSPYVNAMKLHMKNMKLYSYFAPMYVYGFPRSTITNNDFAICPCTFILNRTLSNWGPFLMLSYRSNAVSYFVPKKLC